MPHITIFANEDPFVVLIRTNYNAHLNQDALLHIFHLIKGRGLSLDPAKLNAIAMHPNILALKRTFDSLQHYKLLKQTNFNLVIQAGDPLYICRLIYILHVANNPEELGLVVAKRSLAIVQTLQSAKILNLRTLDAVLKYNHAIHGANDNSLEIATDVLYDAVILDDNKLDNLLKHETLFLFSDALDRLHGCQLLNQARYEVLLQHPCLASAHVALIKLFDTFTLTAESFQAIFVDYSNILLVSETIPYWKKIPVNGGKAWFGTVLAICGQLGPLKDVAEVRRCFMDYVATKFSQLGLFKRPPPKCTEGEPLEKKLCYDNN